MSKQQKVEVIKHFDAWSAQYEKEVWGRDTYFHRRLKNQVMNAILKSNKQRILELGVGPGIYLKYFIQKRHDATGIDISLEMLRITKNKLKSAGYNDYNLVLADAEYLPFRFGAFNLINCIEMLRHLPQPYKTIWKVIREARRVVTKQGSLLINVPNILFPLNLFSVIYYTIPRNIMRLFNKKIGFQYSQNVSFPHFPVLYNEPEDHMYNLLFMKMLSNNLHLKISKLKGIFFFPAVPKIFFALLKKVDLILGSSFWLFFAYSVYMELNHL